MYRHLSLMCLLGGCLIFSGCSVTKTVRPKKESVSPSKGEETSSSQTQSKQGHLPSKKQLTTDQKVINYLRVYGPIAQQEMKSFKIPASITLAQGLLESGFGEGRLAIEGNNHFGIKCHSGWRGKRIYHDDDEKGECFRVYKDPSRSYRDHSLFLTERSRYAFLFRLGKRDYKAWARGLKKAGYATDPQYPQKLIRLIERFDLDQYDTNKKINPVDKKVRLIGDNSKLYIVQKGDTLYSIAKSWNVEINEIKRMNQLNDNTIYLGQELILPKK